MGGWAVGHLLSPAVPGRCPARARSFTRIKLVWLLMGSEQIHLLPLNNVILKTEVPFRQRKCLGKSVVCVFGTQCLDLRNEGFGFRKPKRPFNF